MKDVCWSLCVRLRTKYNLIKNNRMYLSKNRGEKMQTGRFFHFLVANAVTSVLSGSELSELGYFWFINGWESLPDSAWHRQCLLVHPQYCRTMIPHIQQIK